MPRRKEVLATGETYHIFNRSVSRKKIFHRKSLCEEAQKRIWFYQFIKQNIQFSQYKRLNKKIFIETHNLIQESTKAVKIHSYCLMPNHFHFLATQLEEDGIKHLVSNFQSSFAQFCNKKNSYKGSMFEPQFKVVRIETDEQFLHVSRYIHLNPLTGYIVKDWDELLKYPWSSLPLYAQKKVQVYDFVCTDEVLSHISNPSDYLKFVQDQADYQRKLIEMEHQLLDLEGL